jgi:hypothetical protein
MSREIRTACEKFFVNKLWNVTDLATALGTQYRGVRSPGFLYMLWSSGARALPNLGPPLFLVVTDHRQPTVCIDSLSTKTQKRLEPNRNAARFAARLTAKEVHNLTRTTQSLPLPSLFHSLACFTLNLQPQG